MEVGRAARPGFRSAHPLRCRLLDLPEPAAAGSGPRPAEAEPYFTDGRAQAHLRRAGTGRVRQIAVQDHHRLRRRRAGAVERLLRDARLDVFGPGHDVFDDGERSQRDHDRHPVCDRGSGDRRPLLVTAPLVHRTDDDQAGGEGGNEAGPGRPDRQIAPAFDAA
ncbi:hypothetical protein D9M70_519670 [compost metagenome]